MKFISKMEMLVSDDKKTHALQMRAGWGVAAWCYWSVNDIFLHVINMCRKQLVLLKIHIDVIDVRPACVNQNSSFLSCQNAALLFQSHCREISLGTKLCRILSRVLMESIKTTNLIIKSALHNIRHPNYGKLKIQIF